MRLEFAPLGIKVFLIEPGAMETGIFATSRASREAWLAEQPDLERRYRPAFAAMERAFEKSGADDSEVVVRAAWRLSPVEVPNSGLWLARAPACSW